MANTLSVACSYCSAVVGEPCLNLKTQRPMSQLVRSHPCRVLAANPELNDKPEEWWQR